MSDTIIEARGLTKSFAGGVNAIRELNLAVKRGSVFGLIGRNGSGKSTTLRLLFGLLRPDRGSARILGWNFWEAPRGVRQRAAYVSEAQRLPGRLSLEELSRCLGRLNPRWDLEYARKLAGRWALPWKRELGALSGGEQRRAAILLAFAGRPEVLVLDEPAAGFDPVARHDLAARILEALMDADGCTVLLSTHHIGDLERMADSVGIINHGQMALSARLEDLLNQNKRVQVIFETAEAPEGFQIPGAIRTRRAGAVLNAIVRWTGGAELEALRATTQGRIQVFPVGLEELFTELFGSEDGDESGHWPERLVYEACEDWGTL